MTQIKTKDLIHELLADLLGGNAPLARCQFLKQTESYAIAIVQRQHDTQSYVVKLAGPDAPLDCPFEQTAKLHRRIAEHTTIPVAPVIGADESYQRWPWRYIVTKKIEGVTWKQAEQEWSPSESVRVFRQLGDTVAQLHGISLTSFDASLYGTPAASYLDSLTMRSAHHIKNQRLRDLFHTVLQDNADLFQNISSPQLCHDDLHGFNLLVKKHAQGWQLACILDFDKAWAGNGESDLARLALWRGMTNRHFWEAYTARRSIDPLYAQRRSIHQLLWCLEFAQPTAQHLKDTNQVCAELNIPPIRSFDL